MIAAHHPRKSKVSRSIQISDPSYGVLIENIPKIRKFSLIKDTLHRICERKKQAEK
jgi:hypothetical protein